MTFAGPGDSDFVTPLRQKTPRLPNLQPQFNHADARIAYLREEPTVIRLLLFAALGIVIGCNKPSPPGTTPGVGNAAPIRVKVAGPQKQATTTIIEQPATIMAYEITPLVAKLPGYLGTIAIDPRTKRPIDMGSEVQRGQLLATIELPEIQAKLAERVAIFEQAEADCAVAQAELKVHDELIREAEARVDEARAGVERARADVTRWTTQLAYEDELLRKMTLDPESRNVTVKQLDAARATFAEAQARVASARAAVEERKARRNRADADRLAAEARVRVAQAQVNIVKSELTYTEIRAPFDGVITTRNVHPGHFVQPGVVLMTVADIQRVRVVVDVPEAAMERAKVGSAAMVRVPSLRHREFTQAVAITRSSGVVQPDTRTLRVELEIDNADRTLKPGMYAIVTITGESSEVMVLPSACLMSADETHYIYLVESGQAVKYRVRIGRVEAGQTQVLDRRRATATVGNWLPFSGSESAIIGNLGALSDGAAVEVAKD